jgi:hypothetical protein
MDILIFPGQLTLGQKVKLLRIQRRLRQIDVACLATEWLKKQDNAALQATKVTVADVFKLEQNCTIPWFKKTAILAILGLLGEDGNGGKC